MLLDWIPGPLIRTFASPYVAGDSHDQALRVARELLDRTGMLCTLDLLAEEVQSTDQCSANERAYHDLLQAVAADPHFPSREVRPTVSVKASSFTLEPFDRGGLAPGSREAVFRIAATARDLGIGLTIDMEDHTWTDFTLDITNELFASGHDVGTVLQTRLHRTEADLAAIPEGMRVRMVIGIYPEPAEIALTDKRAMKERLLTQSQTLLERGAIVELATHDEAIIQRFYSEVVNPGNVASERFEIQMLYGVPRGPILRRIRNGDLSSNGTGTPSLRLYVPFATDWSQATAYCRRRLQSNPDLAIYVIRNLLQSFFGRRSGVSQYDD